MSSIAASRAKDGTLRADWPALRIGSHAYKLASEAMLKGAGSTARKWNVKHRTSQNAATQRFSIPMLDFSQGAGFSYHYEPIPNTYAWSSGFDATSPGVLATWPVRTTGASFTTTDVRGWQFELGGYLYCARGRYVAKYKIVQGTSSWPIVELHDLDGTTPTGKVIAGRPEVFKGKAYVPVRTGATGTITRFQELTTVATFDAEVQTIVIAGSPAAGTYVVHFDGKDTAAIVFNASGVVLQAALRLIPGLEQVTVATAGVSPNFTHTVTMTGVGALLGAASPPQMTSSLTGMGGGSSITHATTHAGTSDTWTLGPADIFAKWFRLYGVKLGRGQGDAAGNIDKNRVYFVEDDPMTSGDWAPASDTGYEFGENSHEVNDAAEWDVYFMVGKENGLYSLDTSFQTHTDIPDFVKFADVFNCVGMEATLGELVLPTKSGLISWDGGSYGVIGPDQEKRFNGNVDQGVGRIYSIAPAGDVAYYVANDGYRGDAIFGQFRNGEARVGVATRTKVWHTLEVEEESRYESVIILSAQGEPSAPKFPADWSDSNAVGTLAWSTPANAAADDEAAATAAGTGTTHYLKGLSPQPGIPTEATVVGVVAEVKRKGWSTLAPTDDATGGYTHSANAVYATARSGSGLAAATTASIFAGQYLLGGNYHFYLGYLSFDTSAIPDAATVLSAQLNVFGSRALAAGGTTLQARLYDYGAALTTADFVAGANLAAQTLLATVPLASFPGSGNAAPDMVSEAAFIANINKTGDTRILFCVDDQVSGAPPIASGPFIFYGAGVGQDPILTVTYRDVLDNIVKLVISGAVAGNSKADAVTPWPGAYDIARYGGASDLWGNAITPAIANAADMGIVLSAVSTGVGTFDVDYIALTFFYTVPGQADVATLISVLKIDSTRTVAHPVIRQLPRNGSTVAYDPNLARARDNCTFQTSRHVGPGRNMAKTYDFAEFFCEMSASNGLGPPLNVQYSLNDTDWEYLLDADGNTLEVGAELGSAGAGTVTAFFPRLAAAWTHQDNRTLALRFVLGTKSGLQVDTSVFIRDLIAYGWYRPIVSGEFSHTIALGDVMIEGGTLQLKGVKAAIDDLVADCGPGSFPVRYHSPDGRLGYAIFEEPEFREAWWPWEGNEVPTMLATLTGKWMHAG